MCCDYQTWYPSPTHIKINLGESCAKGNLFLWIHVSFHLCNFSNNNCNIHFPLRTSQSEWYQTGKVLDYVKVSTALKSWKNTKGEPRSKHSRVTPGSKWVKPGLCLDRAQSTKDAKDFYFFNF